MGRPFKPKGTHKKSKNWTIDPDLALVVENTSTKLRIGESTLINRLLRKHLVEFAYEIITNGAPVDEPV